MLARAANAYRRVDLDSAPKSIIVEKLFARFEQDIAVARESILAKDILGKAAAIDHASRIVIELTASLDHGVAPELCANLAALYDYALVQLSEANAKLVTEPLDRALRVMRELGQAFTEAHPR